jgi:hypothetical protein
MIAIIVLGEGLDNIKEMDSILDTYRKGFNNQLETCVDIHSLW